MYQVREHKISSENRVHFSEGFIQVPVADSKELYGIKFKDVVLGEEFYMRLVRALGKLCVYACVCVCVCVCAYKACLRHDNIMSNCLFPSYTCLRCDTSDGREHIQLRFVASLFYLPTLNYMYM